MSRPLASDMARELTTGVTTTIDAPIWLPIPTSDPRIHPADTMRPGWIYAGAGATHTIHHPPLLDQIAETIRTNTRDGGQAIHSTFGSKPAARLDCLALTERIDRESATVATELGIDPRQDTRARIRSIGAHATPGSDAYKALQSWWITARILTQHDEPPAAPFAPCPLCGQWSTLRIRLDDEIAVCTNCHHTWTDTEFRRLCIWVEWASRHMHGSRHWVDAADYGYDDLGYVVECTECAPERRQRAIREANRLRQPRRYKQTT